MPNCYFMKSKVSKKRNCIKFPLVSLVYTLGESTHDVQQKHFFIQTLVVRIKRSMKTTGGGLVVLRYTFPASEIANIFSNMQSKWKVDKKLKAGIQMGLTRKQACFYISGSTNYTSGDIEKEDEVLNSWDRNYFPTGEINRISCNEAGIFFKIRYNLNNESLNIKYICETFKNEEKMNNNEPETF